LGNWFRTEQRDAIRALLESNTSRVRQILNTKLLQRVVDEHMTARQNHEKLLWTIANLEIFLRQAESRSTSSASRSPTQRVKGMEFGTPGLAE
jgi:hypothetical protein